MASKYAELRSSRREKGRQAREEVKKRAISGGSSPDPAKQKSRFDAIRNRSTDAPTVVQKEKESNFITAQNRNEQRMGKMDSTSTKSVQPDFLKPKPNALDVGTQIKKFQDTAPKYVSKNEQLGNKLRDVPVLGSVYKGLDYLAEKTKPAADIAQELYTPGAGLSAVTAAEQAGAKLISKIAPKAPKIVSRLLTGAGTGAVTGAGQSLASHPEEGFKGAVTGAGTGAIGGAALEGVAAGIGKGYAKIRAARKGTGTAQPKQENYKGNWFTNLFGDQGLGIAAGAAQKGKAVSSGDVIVKNAIKNNKGKIIDNVVESAKATHRTLVNKFEPLKKGGKGVFEAAEDASRGNQLANQIMGKEFVTPEGNVVGEGFQSIMKSVPRGKDKTLFDYLIVKDAQARVPRGERVFDESLKVPDPTNPMNHIELNSEEGLKVRLAQLEKQNPWLPAMSNRWNAFTKNLREIYGVNEGLLTPEANAALEQARPNYIKMRRQFTRGEKPRGRLVGSSAADTFTGKKAPIQQVNKYGSARNIVDPRKTMSESVGQWVNNALRNRVGQEFVRNIKADPASFKDIAEILPNNAPSAPGVKNTITAMVDGNEVKVRIHDPELYEAFQGLNPQQLGLVLQVAKFGSNLTKRSATGVLAPVFAAKSAIVDLPTALIQAKGNRLTFLADYVHALGSGFASKFGNNKWSQLAKDYERAGGGFSAALRGEKTLNKSLSKLERNPVLSPKSVGRAAASAVTAPFRATESIADVFENAPRIAAYKGELRRLGGAKTPENVRKAMQEGREITVNYSRKGSVSDELEAISPYTNAAIQGVTRLGRQFKNKPIKTLAAVTAVVGIPKAYEYAQFHDDPDYQRLPAREKFRNLIIDKNEDGTFKKIPLEPSYAAFGAAALDFFQYAKEKDPEAFKGMLDSLSNAYLPPLASGALQGLTQGAEGTESAIDKSVAGLFNATSIGPLNSVYANQSFTGAPIDNAAVSDRSPQYRYDEKSSSIAKWIGDKLNFSPMKTDYLIKQYGGDLARMGLPLLSDVGGGTKQQTLLRNFIVDPVFTNNLTNDYYTGKSLITAATKDNAEVGAELPNWYDENLAKELSTTKKDSITAKLKELTAQKKEVNSNRSLSAAEKSQRLRAIQRKMNEIYIETNAKMKAAGVPFPNR